MPSSYRTVNTFHLGYTNQSVYAVSGTSRCLFSDKYKTHKYSVGRAYSCWMLNCWCITWPVGFKRLMLKTKGSSLITNNHQPVNEVWGIGIESLELQPQLYKSQPNKRHQIVRKLRQKTFSETTKRKDRLHLGSKPFQLKQVSKLNNVCILTTIRLLVLFTKYSLSENGSVSFGR
jgi:hypothetical protein